MHKVFLQKINIHYLPEAEYLKLDAAMSSKVLSNEYIFYSAIFQEGVVIGVWSSGFTNEDLERTKTQFPNLYKIIQYTKNNSCSYFELSAKWNFENSEDEENYNLKRFNW